MELSRSMLRLTSSEILLIGGMGPDIPRCQISQGFRESVSVVAFQIVFEIVFQVVCAYLGTRSALLPGSLPSGAFLLLFSVGNFHFAPSNPHLTWGERIN